jgi:hypothetical protein
MAPLLSSRNEDVVVRHEARQSDSILTASTGGLSLWAILFIVLGVITLLSVIGFAVACWLGRRKRLAASDVSADPLRGETRNRNCDRHVSESKRQILEEQQRAELIQKSLASRSSSRQDRNSQLMDGQWLPEPVRTSEADSLRDDWKEYEARLEWERTRPGQTPDMQLHPALSHSISEPPLALSPPRSISPGRSSYFNIPGQDGAWQHPYRPDQTHHMRDTGYLPLS